ncbi:rRNA methyltransferase [Alteracholeplasma palmae J233]|uniref:rRNA methyltransferase n=1 Tax=Alteracholeplasma palmae (strain ATCC 49389 / J233) TaxID=1318466 RepID=U4KL78_ALTPJ|nr:TlyA family RNA methyltransferase [Alteracholeplasma palmae]CCV64649.1 rRNA methyltransferase [Alteracholeplasma palmae J233]
MRLDHYLVAYDLVSTRSEGQDLIKQGFVLVNDKQVTKSGYELKETDVITLLKTRKYVSRAGEKLEHAINEFKIDFTDKVVVDVGSSTGGFTQCALNYKAKLVYAYDVGTEQLDKSLRDHSKIILNEQTNILDVTIPEHDIMTIDVSFTSIIPILRHISNSNKELIALIKPQFEVSPKELKKGILKNIKVEKQVIEKIVNEVNVLGYEINGFMPSIIKGKDGNQEFLIYLKK